MRVSIGRTSRSRTISAPRRSGQLTPPCSVLLTGIGLLDAVGVLDAVGGGVDDVDADDWAEGVGLVDGVGVGDCVAAALRVQAGAGATAAVGSNLTHP